MSSKIELLKAIAVLRKDYPNGIPLSLFSDKTSSPKELAKSSEIEAEPQSIKIESKRDTPAPTI